MFTFYGYFHFWKIQSSNWHAFLLVFFIMSYNIAIWSSSNLCTNVLYDTLSFDQVSSSSRSSFIWCCWDCLPLNLSHYYCVRTLMESVLLIQDLGILTLFIDTALHFSNRKTRKRIVIRQRIKNKGSPVKYSISNVSFICFPTLTIKVFFLDNVDSLLSRAFSSILRVHKRFRVKKFFSSRVYLNLLGLHKQVTSAVNFEIGVVFQILHFKCCSLSICKHPCH